MKIQLSHTFEEVIAVDNFLQAWREFIKGKRKKQDVQEFQMRLMDNIFSCIAILQVMPIGTVGITLSTSLIPNHASFTKQSSGIGSCTMRFIGSSIRSLIGRLSPTRIHAELAKELIKHLIAFARSGIS